MQRLEWNAGDTIVRLGRSGFLPGGCSFDLSAAFVSALPTSFGIIRGNTGTVLLYLISRTKFVKSALRSM